LGYKKGKDFSQMPKIFLRTRGKSLIAYEKKKHISIDKAELSINEDSIFIKFPLSILENPDYIFSRIILKGKIRALYIAAWTILKI
jgi:hypothetical protein